MGRRKWEPEVSLGEAFMKLGQAVESIRSVRDTLWYLARVTDNPAHHALLESLIEAQTATNATYDQLARDPRQPYKGEKAMAEYCRRRGYSDLVVQGGLEYLISSWEQTVREVETGYSGMVLEHINDLDTRQIIHGLWQLTSGELQIRYGLRLDEADERFVAATEAVEESFSPGVRDNPDRYPPMVRWLYYRVPKNRPPDW